MVDGQRSMVTSDNRLSTMDYRLSTDTYEAFDSRAFNRDLYRLAVLRWMMPLPAILSIREMAAPNCFFAAVLSLPSMTDRICFSVVRSWDRNFRLRSRCTRLCRCAFIADA